MAGSGPAPDPNSRRQAKLAGLWLDLPAGGYNGPIPDFPLVKNLGVDADIFNDREPEVWQAIWRSPQAAAWVLYGWYHDVGLYVRALVQGEFGDLDQAKEARMWSDRLGLNPTAMLKLHWRISEDELGARREEKPKPKSKKRALRSVDAVAGA